MDAQAKLHRRNKWTWSVGTIGRDMTYTFITTYLIYFLTNVLTLSDWVLYWVSGLMLATRLVDCVLDIVMGSIVDNTRTRWGSYKPWILGGVLASGTFTLLLVADLGARDASFIVAFELIYLCWSLSWTTNDIPYWSLLPALSLTQKLREQMGSLARIFAAIGQAVIVLSVIPVTTMLTPSVGARGAWLIYVADFVIIMVIGQFTTLVGTKIPTLVVDQQRIKVRELFSIVFHNDQLLWIAIGMILFMTGYSTTVTFGTYYFQYIFHNLSMYSPFGGVLIGAQIVAFIVFPVLRRHFTRRVLYSGAIILVAVGYVGFFFSPMNILVIGAFGLILFFGVGIVNVLMLAFLTDTVDYGHWKFGHRNTAVTFAVQPFINKVGAALAAEIVALILIASGETAAAQGNTDILPDNGVLLIKIMMIIMPLALILIGYVIYRWKWRIDEKFHAQMLADLHDRGQLVDEDENESVAG